MSSSSEILSSLQMSPSKAFFISVISVFKFLALLKVCFSILNVLLTLHILHALHCLMSTLSIRNLHILIIVVFNSWSDNPTSLSCLALMLVLFLQSVFLSLFVYNYYYFFFAKHDVLDKRNCCKWTFSNVVVRYRGRIVFDNSLIMPQSFTEPMPMGCKFHQCSSVPPPLGRIRWLDWTEVGYFPSSRSVRLW